MRNLIFAVFRAALIVCALACASSFPAFVLAQQANDVHRTETDNTVRVLKPRVIKLQPAGDEAVRLRRAPAPKQIIKPAANVEPSVTGRPATRPRLKSTTLLPPAGATPKLQVAPVPAVPLPLQLPAAQAIPVTADTADDQSPAVSTAGAEPEDDQSSIQQAATDRPVRKKKAINVETSPRLQAAPRVHRTPIRGLPPRQTGLLQTGLPAQTAGLNSRVHRQRAPAASVSPSRQTATFPPTASAQPRLVPTVVQQAGPLRQPQRRSPVRQVADHETSAAGRRSDQRVLLPIEPVPTADDVSLDGGQDGLVTLIATGADLPAVLRMIADHHGLNLVVGPNIHGSVTVSIRGARLDEVLDAILGVAGFSWHQVGNLLYVTGASNTVMDPRVQGKTLQVYPLNYVSAADLETVANGLLSPVGTVHVITSSNDDQLKTREMLVVEDTVAAHRRIAEYIAQVDIPPRQVLIEAHVMQVALSEEERHGVNWRGLARWRGANITLEGSGFANDNAGGPAVALRVDGNDMDTFIELIRQNTSSRTLASPKVSVVNHQEAKIQIGQRLPYSVATTTQTSTIQNVQFLDVGIVLTVTPVITEDGNVLMTVLPKVSGGKITESGFPEEDTTEVQTTVLMPDGGGIVIGGLIREENSQAKSMVPGIGRVPVVGRLFRRRSDESRRNELVVALVTHVLPDVHGQRCHELRELDQTLPNYSKHDVVHPPQMIRGCYRH